MKIVGSFFALWKLTLQPAKHTQTTNYHAIRRSSDYHLKIFINVLKCCFLKMKTEMPDLSWDRMPACRTLHYLQHIYAAQECKM